MVVHTTLCVVNFKVMLIDNVNKTLIIHNPKTGGGFCIKNNNNKNVELVHCWSENVFGKKLHPFYTEISSIEKYKDYKKIVIVRNPYDRFVSAFNFFKPTICSCYNISSIEEYADYLLCHKEELYSREIPFVNPQSCFIGDDVELMRYEDTDTWKYLCLFLNIDFGSVKIKEHYHISDDLKSKIKELYSERDSVIFNIYND